MSRRSWGTALWLAVILALSALSAWADSQARIVRLSDVEGTVQMDRNTGQGYEKAFLNTPMVQGMKLQTGDDGRAEVEFEDGTTLRITPKTTVEFPELSLRDSGAKASTIVLQEGAAYVNFTGKKDDEFRLNFGHESVSLTRAAHFRVQVNDTDATLAVFKGEVSAIGPAGSVEVEKKKSATFDLAAGDKYTLADNFEEDPFDNWDKQQEQYHDQYTSNNSYGSPYSYGMSDLNYYGNFMNVPGYGMMWQPYFAGMGWDPFMNGAWMWYPGFGYTWVSAYPWGWMPYRYGNWLFVPNYGWMWQPGNNWAGWNTIPRFSNPPQRFVPPQPPANPGHNVVVVNRGPAPPTRINPRELAIPNNSAGLGIPRGSVRNLGKVSQELERDGRPSATVRTAPPTRDVPAATTAPSAPRTVAPPRTTAPAPRPMPRPATRPAPSRSSPH